MWPFNNRIKKARNGAFDKACRLLTMQLHGASESDRFVDGDLWPLGYCFGILQASLEAVDSKARLRQTDYESYITNGFGVVFADEAFGVIQYRVSLSSMADERFQAGRYAGLSDYVQVVNTKADRSYGLVRYLNAQA